MKKLTTLLFVLVFAGTTAFAQNNEATIDQVGDDNDADIEQLGSTNTVLLEQLAEGTVSGASTFATADIDQHGSDNFVNIDQDAFYNFSTANVVQLGNRNVIEGTSSESAWRQSNGGGLLDVYMEGNDNTLYSLRAEAQKNYNEFFLDIIGNDNIVGTEQETGSGDVDIEGNMNTVTLSQLGNNTAYNTATVGIIGSDNGVDITQTLDSNMATVNVTGSYNSTTITQN